MIAFDAFGDELLLIVKQAGLFRRVAGKLEHVGRRIKERKYRSDLVTPREPTGSVGWVSMKHKSDPFLFRKIPPKNPPKNRPKPAEQARNEGYMAFLQDYKKRYPEAAKERIQILRERAREQPTFTHTGPARTRKETPVLAKTLTDEDITYRIGGRAGRRQLAEEGWVSRVKD